MYDRPLCICRTKKYFILTGRRSLTKGTDFSLSDSEYADDTTVLFDSRETLETFSPVLFNCFEKFGMEVHVDHSDQPNKPTKTEVLFGSTPPSSYAESTTFDDRNLQLINLGNNRFQPVVRKFSYLGTTLNIDCRDNEDFVLEIKKLVMLLVHSENVSFQNQTCLLMQNDIFVKDLSIPSYYMVLNLSVLPKSYFLFCVFFTIVV